MLGTRSPYYLLAVTLVAMLAMLSLTIGAAVKIHDLNRRIQNDNVLATLDGTTRLLDTWERQYSRSLPLLTEDPAVKRRAAVLIAAHARGETPDDREIAGFKAFFTPRFTAPSAANPQRPTATRPSLWARSPSHGAAALTLANPDERYPLTAVTAQLIRDGVTGFMENYPNYRGVSVIGAGHWINSLDIILIVEQEVAEAYSAHRAARAVMVGLIQTLSRWVRRN